MGTTRRPNPTGPVSRLRRHRRAVSTVEFALIASALISVTFGIVEISLLLWTKGQIQSVAAITARYGAVTYPTCPAGAADTMKTYVATVAGQWVIPNIVAASDVTPSCAAATCRGAAGKFYVVQITSDHWASVFPYPLPNVTVSATGCYPMA